MKQLLIGKLAVNYAASKTNSAVNTALLPADLALGATGIYLLGINGANAGKTVLVTAANYTTVETLSGVAKSDIQYIFAQGTSDSVLMSKPYKVREFAREYKKEFVAAVNEVTYVGFNGTTGALLGSSPTNFSEATVDFAGSRTQFAPLEEMKSVSATLRTGDTAYDIANKLVIAINANAIDPANVGLKYLAETVADTGVSTAIVFTGNVTYTKGSPVITMTTHDVVAGNYIRLVLDPQTEAITVTAPTVANSVLYKVVSTTTTSITLDRAYNGTTTTLSAANAITATTKGASAPANFGVRLIPYPEVLYNEYVQFSVATGGIIEGSPITYLTGPNPGSGTYNQMLRLEREAQIFSGFWNTVDGYLTRPTSYIAGTVYDLYFFDLVPVVDTTVQSQKAIHFGSIIVAFEDGVSAGDQNQFVFDTITSGANNIFGALGSSVFEAVPFMTGDATPAS